MSFIEACAKLGVDRGRVTFAAHARRKELPSTNPLAARESEPSTELWQKKADALAVVAEGQLWSAGGAHVRAYLATRGLTEETMRRYHLGWIREKLFCDRSDWGLPDVLREDGISRKLMIMPGVIIPCRNCEGGVVRLRVRYWTAEHGGAPPEEPGPVKVLSKYRIVSGSEMRSLVAGDGPTAIVVEGDLDALLLAQDAGDLVTAVALGSVNVRPDPTTAELLRAAPLVLVSLDTDPAGGKEAWTKWFGLENVEVWPIPAKYGKDPGEARGNGLCLRTWVLAALRFFGAAAP